MTLVQPGSFLTLHYRLAGPDGADVINTFHDKPATLTLGTGQLAPAIEQHLLGRAEGTRQAFDVPAGVPKFLGLEPQRAVQMLARPQLFPWVRLDVEGAENIPAEGPAIFASNHLSFSDSIFLPLVVPRKMTFLAKADYFKGVGLKGRLTRAFFRGAGQLPVDRSGGKASNAALEAGLKVLRAGDLLGLYPEGTRSPDGRLYKGKTGVARMALEGGVPVIPVAMVGTDKVQPTGRIIPKVMRVGIKVGEPLDFSRYAGMEDDRFVLRSITDEVMYALMELSGQEYVDMYAAQMKDRLLRARKAKGRGESAD